MDAETIGQPARPRLNRYTKALRRERILTRLRLGWPYARIAGEERVSERPPDRQRRPGSANNRQGVGPCADSARPDRERPSGGGGGDRRGRPRRAIGPYLKVLDQLDRYHKAGATKDVYDDVARERLLSKINRTAARLEAGKGHKSAKEAADLAGGAGEA